MNDEHPKCACHGEPMRFRNHWRCAVKDQESVKAAQARYRQKLRAKRRLQRLGLRADL